MLLRFLAAPFAVAWRYKPLIQTLVKYDLKSHYNAGVYSYAWAVITPLLTIVIYTFVFGFILQASFAGSRGAHGQIGYALGLFAGLIQWDFFSNVITQSPTVISGKPNYVKKVVFPLEILPLVLIAVALFHFIIGLVVLGVGMSCFGSEPVYRVFIVPLLLFPIILYASGLSWLLSSIGVFYQDLSNAITPVMQLLWFASAIFFPIDSVPEQWQVLFYCNPVAAMVDQARRFAVLGQGLNPGLILAHLVAGLLFSSLGLFFFRKTKSAFADVL